ncbi:MAG: RICIN domain-containing protein [Clostridiales bacterium]|nr:RICIN domain-containing protein [Clostridiales bacterium]
MKRNGHGKRFLSLIIAMIMLCSVIPVQAASGARVSKVTSGTSYKVSAGYYYLVPACAPSRALSILNGSRSTGAKACLGVLQKMDRRVWYVYPSSVGGTYFIKNKNSGKVIEARNNTTAVGGAVTQASNSSANRQRWYFIKKGSYYIIQNSISKRVLGVSGGSSAIAATCNLQKYSNASKQRWMLVKYSSSSQPKNPMTGKTVGTSSSGTKKTNTSTAVPKRSYYNTTINGKRTLKSYLQNAMVPCGRTLYIWGGGWGSDASVIGYQSGWYSFFKSHGTSSYNYKNYRYKYGNGLDCSGFAAWVLYNTLYTANKKNNLVTQSTTVASTYASKGWATLSKNGKDRTFRPGDVVSMSGHVWISLGQYGDGSVLLVHSSPKGVQISGTSGTAASMAKYYMKKYFPSWPYEARTVSKSYLSYVGKARWKVTGSGRILSDPDGVQKMSASQVMNLLF